MKAAYVAGAYRAETIYEIVQNIRRAEEVALELWRFGYVALCPHLNSALFDGACDDSVWLAGSLELMRRCDLVVVIPGYTSSDGSMAEVEEARERGIPVYYWPQDYELLEREAASSEDSRRPAHWLRDAGFGTTCAEDDERRTH